MSDAGDRRRAALGVVAAVERAAGLHRVPLPRRFAVAGDTAVRVGADISALPVAVRPMHLPGPAATTARVSSRAALVRFGKFDRDGSVRARAYVLDGAPTALKLQTDRRDGRHGIDREVRARREVERLVPGLAPEVRGTGHLPRHRVSWIAEEIVHGTHPAGPRDVDATADAVVGALARLYAASGYSRVPLEDVLEPTTGERFEATVEVAPGLRRFVPHVRELLARGGDLDLAFGHGDLVGSNVLVRDDGSVQLVDWEFARRRPVVDDVGTVLTQAHDKAAAIAVIERHLGAHVGVGPTCLSLRDQLVIAQVRMLSWYEHRRERAERAGRLAALGRDTVRRTKALRALLP